MAKNMILAGCLMMCLLEDFFVIATLKFVGHNVPSPPSEIGLSKIGVLVGD